MSNNRTTGPMDLFSDTLIWDAHAGVFPAPDNDLSFLKDWHQAGVNYVSINVGFDVMDWRQTLKTLTAYRHWLLNDNERFVLIKTIDDIATAKVQNKLAVSFDIEGMNALNGDINMVSTYHALGVRQMLFAYNLNNTAAGGCHDTDIGLSDFGRAIVTEMNKVGMIVDCSHASYKTTLDIMEQSSKPAVFTHSNPTAICPHQRNITDAQIKACAKTGGVIGINGMGIFLGDNDISTPTILRHICYLSELVGPQHIGLGFDYSPKLDIDVGEILASRPDFWPAGNGYDTPAIKHVSPAQLPELAEGLADKGFNDSEIQGVFGENFRRVATRVWVS